MNRRILVFLLFLFGVRITESAAPLVTIYSPSAFQVFQRSMDNTGIIHISGRVESADPYSITAHWKGIEGAWQFSQPVFDISWQSLPVGQDDFTLTIANTTMVIPVVSIGDVYAIAGQSNAVGQGKNLQFYMSSTGLKAAMFGNDYQWHELADPTDTPLNAVDSVSTDGSFGGSQWPLLASYILNACIPVAFIPTARGGTSIQSWQPNLSRKTLEGALEARLSSAGSIRAVLWQQGESDAHYGTKTRAYTDRLEAIADRLYSKFGIPLFAATLAPSHYSSNWSGINEAIATAINERPGVILRGADLTGLTPDASDTVHFTSDENLQMEARLWWLALVEAGYYPDTPCF